jgi:quercetin dioxygenase-like cupin family protein
MGVVQVRSIERPDETRTFPNGSVAMLTVGGVMAARARFEPGWRWSEHVKPIAGTDLCMFLHQGYCLSGSATIRADGVETTIGPGDVYLIEPGHDAWVVGDEPWITVDFSQESADYAKPR